MPAPHFYLRPTVVATLLALNAVAALAQTTTAEPAAGATSSGTLTTVNVEASADASAEGLTKPFAGGQVARGGRAGILGNQDMMSTPFSSTNYTNELIQDQQAKSVADVLLNDPSVRQARGFGNFQELYVVRGFPVYSDDVSYNGLYGMLPRQYIASEFFERVEVFRGANTFLNGAAPGGSGIGGAINLLPKRAPNEPLTRVGFGVQTGGQGFVNLDLARRFGPDDSLGVRVNAVRREGGTGIKNESQQLSAFGVGLDWHNRNVRLSADFGFQDFDLKDGRPSLTPSSTLPIPRAPDARANFAQPWTYSKEKDKFATFRGEVDITDNITAWAAGGVRRSDEDNVLSNPTLTNAFGDTSNTRFSNTRKDRIGTAEDRRARQLRHRPGETQRGGVGRQVQQRPRQRLRHLGEQRAQQHLHAVRLALPDRQRRLRGQHAGQPAPHRPHRYLERGRCRHHVVHGRPPAGHARRAAADHRADQLRVQHAQAEQLLRQEQNHAGGWRGVQDHADGLGLCQLHRRPGQGQRGARHGEQPPGDQCRRHLRAVPGQAEGSRRQVRRRHARRQRRVLHHRPAHLRLHRARPTACTASSATRAWSSRCSASPPRACACSAA
jgi:hypothetical protein